MHTKTRGALSQWSLCTCAKETQESLVKSTSQGRPENSLEIILPKPYIESQQREVLLVYGFEHSLSPISG